MIESVGKSWRFRLEGRLVVAWRRRREVGWVVRCARDVRGWSREDLLRVRGVLARLPQMIVFAAEKEQNE